MTIDTDDLTTRELIIRFSERQQGILRALERLQKEMATLSERHATKEDLVRLEAKLNTYVTRTEFAPVRTIVYGLVGIILSAVATALVALVVIG